jgi:hypothetical protein
LQKKTYKWSNSELKAINFHSCTTVVVKARTQNLNSYYDSECDIVAQGNRIFGSPPGPKSYLNNGLFRRALHCGIIYEMSTRGQLRGCKSLGAASAAVEINEPFARASHEQLKHATSFVAPKNQKVQKKRAGRSLPTGPFLVAEESQCGSQQVKQKSFCSVGPHIGSNWRGSWGIIRRLEKFLPAELFLSGPSTGGRFQKILCPCVKS